MSRAARHSVFAPIAFAFCAAVFAAGAAYTWWLDYGGRGAIPSSTVRAATLPPRESPPITAIPAPEARPARMPASERRARPSVVRKCKGADGVPVFTNAQCPAGTTLVGETAVEVASDAPAASPAPPVAAANANASVIIGGSGYGIPDRQYRRDVDRERAWDRCERAKVRAEAELAALRHRRKMSDIRRWENYAEDECAAYEIMTR